MKSTISSWPRRLAMTALSLVLPAASFAADGPGVPNVAYPPERVGEILSKTQIKGISATALVRGYLYVPLSFDGGGRSGGEFAFYDVSNPSNPQKVFHTRDDLARYHTPGGSDYMGDLAEQHNITISEDLILISEVGSSSAGFSILDTAPLYDNDPTTKPGVVSRYAFPGVTNPTGYDGFSFSLAWQGRRYVYAPTGAHGLHVIDTTDLANPVQIKHLGRYQLGDTLSAAWPIGNHLILSSAKFFAKHKSGTFKAKIYDISNPANPVQLSSFEGPMGYAGFVYGSSFYGAGVPIARHDFTNPSNIVRTDLYTNPQFDRPEYGFGKEGHLFIGHYPGATKWKLNNNTVEPAGRVNSGIVDDHAFLNPLGNLILLCSDHGNDRQLMIGVHTTEKDTTAPHPLFVSPLNNAVNQHVRSRVGVSFSEHVDPKSLSSSALTLRKASTGAVIPGSYSAMQGIVNFVPDAPLEANTTYEAVLTAGGVRDQVGNTVPVNTTLTRFSTGSILNEYAATITAAPRPVNTSASLSLNVTNNTGQTFEHSWDFGDGSAPTAFSTGTTTSHAYTAPGNYAVSVRSRIQGQNFEHTFNGVQIVHLPIPASKPVNQSTIVLDASRAMIWNVNKDNHSVSGIDTGTHVRTREVAVGNKPASLALGPNDTLWVVNQGSSTISVINRSTGTVTTTYNLPAGSAPHGVVVDPQASYAYVSLEATGQVAKVRTTDGTIMSLLSVGPAPRGLSLDPVRQMLWVSRFISPDEGGELTRVNLSSFTVEAVVPLAAVNEPDGLQNGRGIPNYLAPAVLSPDLSQAFVPSKKDNILRGLKRDGLPLTFENTVRSMAANVDLATGVERTSKRLDFDNSDFATAAAFSPLGNLVYFATSGSATVWAVDAYDPSAVASFSSGGQAPDGIAVSADGSKLYIHNFMDRSVTVFQSNFASNANYETAPQTAKISTVTTESLSPEVLKGKQLFYSSSDPRMAQEGYMSCASCHLDGGHDGRTWDFSNFGEGLRNTIDLKGRGEGHGLIHWSGNFDEVQDFEGQIRSLPRGVGLMGDGDFNHRTRRAPLGEQKTGLSSDLDALATYIRSLNSAGRSPYRNSDSTLTPPALAGREIFRQENCASCHGGTAFSDSEGIVLHDVGTITSGSGTRLGEVLTGLDTPTLRGLWQTAPYLHDGSAGSLRDVLVAKNVSRFHGDLSDRTSAQIDQLVAYLESIDDLEVSAPTNAAGSAPVVTTLSARTSPLGQELSLALSASGTGALSWRAVGLPPGLLLNRVSGLISGVPWQAGVYRVTLGVQDSAGRTASTVFAWTVLSNHTHRYVKLASLSSQDGQMFSAMAEFNLLGTDGLALPRSRWNVTTNSQNNAITEAATNVLDGRNETFWHTQQTGSPTPFPHDLVFDLGIAEGITGFSYLPRQNSNIGLIKDYQLFQSTDGVGWGSPVDEGTFASSLTLKTVLFDGDGDGFFDLLESSLGSDPANAASRPPEIFSGMLGWWMLDEASGIIAEDYLLRRPGTILGSPARVPGASGGAVELYNVSQSIRLPALHLNTNTFTVSCWVRRNGPQSSGAGLVFARDPSNANGLSFYNTTNQLGYYWNNSANTYNFASNLTVPDGVWTFCALVVEPTKATLYMHPEGGTLQSAVNPIAHPVVNLAADWHLGRDTYADRGFKGRIDDCKMHSRALSAAEMATLANHAPSFHMDPIVGTPGREGAAYSGSLAGAASDSDPGDAITYTKIAGPSWLSVAANGVLGGTPTVGLEGANVFKIRVTDTQGARDEAMLKIAVQSPPPQPPGPAGPLDSDGDGFSDSLELALATNPNSASSQPSAHYRGIRGWWRLNEGSGSLATDATGRTAQNGTLLRTPIWVPGVSGSGLALNGVDQSIRIPALGISSNTVTLSGWIKRQGVQVYKVGIANKAGFTTGLDLRGTTHQLSYRWNGAANTYTFASNLVVPDNVWTFVGIVVEPTRATLYMQPAGSQMQTAVNTVNHGPVSFDKNIYLGQDPYESRFFKGLVDDFRFYERALNTAEMQLAAITSLPPPWQVGDIGTVGLLGSQSYEGESFAITASGADHLGATDQLRFAWQPLTGDGSITARVASQGRRHAWSKAGVMIRESQLPGSKHCFMFFAPDHGYSMQFRSGTSVASASAGSTPGILAGWVRLTRTGDVVRAYRSPDGVTWTQQGSDLALPMASSISIGLAVSSMDNSTTSTAVFDNVTVIP